MTEIIKEMIDNSVLKDIINSKDFYLDIENYKYKEMKMILDKLNEIEEDNFLYEIEFVYDGKLKAAARPRKGTNKKTKQSIWYDPTSANKREIKNFLKETLDGFDPINGEVYLTVDIYKKTIGAFNKVETFLAEAKILRPTKKPDVDNYAKQFMDSANGVLWMDDAAVVNLITNKYYSQYPRIEINVVYREKKISEK